MGAKGGFQELLFVGLFAKSDLLDSGERNFEIDNDSISYVAIFCSLNYIRDSINVICRVLILLKYFKFTTIHFDLVYLSNTVENFKTNFFVRPIGGETYLESRPLSEEEKRIAELEGSTKKHALFEAKVSDLNFPYNNSMVAEVFFTNPEGDVLISEIMLSGEIKWGIFSQILKLKKSELKKNKKIITYYYENSKLKLNNKFLTKVDMIYTFNHERLGKAIPGNIHSSEF